MDFHSLSRKELQAFCKKNKIPANMTNAAMADALKALEIVEGMEEFMQSSQSESAQSSIELLDSSEVTSPYVPPTAGRSTRRRNVLKDDAEAVTSIMTTTRRTTRKTAAKASNESQVDAMKTPAMVAHASTRKVQIASACLKMDSQLKKCVEEEKKDALMTPAAVGVASRRRRAEETEKKVYSTRRSVRLAVKSVQMLSEQSELSNNELFAKDCEDREATQKEDQEVHIELSGITGADAIDNMEEDKEKSEVVSAKKDIAMGEVELSSTREEETCTDFVVEVQPNEEICDNTEYPGDEDAVVPVNVSDKVEQSEGSIDDPTCETEVAVENSQEVDIEIDAGSQDEAADFESKVGAIVSGDKVEEVECDDDKEVGAEDDQDLNVTLGKLTELRLQQEADAVDLDIPEELKKTEKETFQLEESEEAVASVKKSPSKLSAVPVHEPSVEMGNKALMTGLKENSGSGTGLMIMEDTIKPAKDSGETQRSLNEESLRKLSKMLKEKLQISSKSSKQGKEALPRSALQVLPENQLTGGNGK